MRGAVFIYYHQIGEKVSCEIQNGLHHIRTRSPSGHQGRNCKNRRNLESKNCSIPMGATKPLEYHFSHKSQSLGVSLEGQISPSIGCRTHHISVNGVRLSAGIKLSRTGSCHGRRNKVLTASILLIMNLVSNQFGRPPRDVSRNWNVVLAFGTHQIATTIR